MRAGFSAAAPASAARPHQQLLAAGARFRSQPGSGRLEGVQPGIATVFLPQLLLREVVYLDSGRFKSEGVK